MRYPMPLRPCPECFLMSLLASRNMYSLWGMVHSIIGSLMDAHPHVVIAQQFHVFNNFDELNKVPSQQWRDHFFELLYNDSVKDATSTLTDSSKGYSLEVVDSWQGKFDKYIKIIGDKSGAETTKHYIKHNGRII